MPKIKPSKMNVTSTPKPYAKPTKYEIGQHGAKKQEQKRLTKETGNKVSGDTHQSEHTVGFEPLNRTSGKSRKQNAALENKAPAYQEVKDAHRKHIGTGTNTQKDASGFDSKSYRDTQRKLIGSNDASSAVQINQLGYAFDPKFKTQAATPAGVAADNSFQKMVTNMKTVPYAKGNQTVDVPVDAKQKAEMLLARQTAQTGRFPSVAEENAARLIVGLNPIKP